MKPNEELINIKEQNVDAEKIFNYTSSIWTLCLKIYIVLICIVISSTQINWTEASFYEWLWPNRAAITETEVRTVLPNIPFELSETNDRFITETSKLLGVRLSELDFCQQRVILSLKTSCKTLSDEELGKLTIGLMNCQQIIESRHIVECSPNMKLLDCIAQMSPDELSLYNKSLLRSKSLCLAIRQDHFRGMAEMTVNRLMDSAHDHIALNERLKSSQNELEKTILNSIEEVADNQLKLMEKQKDLMKMADSQRITAETNLREIQREKNFIKNGQIELTEFILNLKTRFKEGLNEIQDQNVHAKDVFKGLFNDLERLNEVSNKISKRLEEVSETVFEKNREASTQFQETIVKLKDANEIVQNFSKVLNNMKDSFDGKVEWLEKYMGDKNIVVHNFLIIAMHTAYLLIGMICLLFIQAEMKNRLVLLLVTASNLFLVLNDQIKMDFILLTKTIFILTLVNFTFKLYNNYYIVSRWKEIFTKIRTAASIENKNSTNYHEKIRSTNSIKNEREFNNNNNNNNGYEHRNAFNNNELRNNSNINNNDNDSVCSGASGSGASGRTTPSALPSYQRESFLRAPRIIRHTIREESSTDGASGNGSRSSTPASDAIGGRCKAITRLGTQCQFSTPSNSSDYCRIHDRLSQEP